MRFSSCQERRNTIWCDIINSITPQKKWVRSRRLLIYVCDLIDSRPLDMNHKAGCCQLGVLTCSSTANRRLFFFFCSGCHTQGKRFPGSTSSGVQLKHLPCLLCFSKVPILFSKIFVPVFIQPVKKLAHLGQVAPLIFQCHYPPNMDE